MHEAPLVDWFAARGEALVVPAIATDPGRGWLLVDDESPTLRDSPGPDGRAADQELARWTAFLPRYAAVQRRTEGAIDELLALGVPDERPERYPEILDGLLADDAIWARVDGADRARTDTARRRLIARTGLVSTLATELAASVAPTIDHGDLHGNNVVVGRDGSLRIFDWGDAVVAHPFTTLTTTMGSFTYHAGLDLDGPELADLREAATGAWSLELPRAELARIAMLALDLGHIGKAAAWERAVRGPAAGRDGRSPRRDRRLVG